MVASQRGKIQTKYIIPLDDTLYLYPHSTNSTVPGCFFFSATTCCSSGVYFGPLAAALLLFALAFGRALAAGRLAAVTFFGFGFAFVAVAVVSEEGASTSIGSKSSSDSSTIRRLLPGPPGACFARLSSGSPIVLTGEENAARPRLLPATGARGARGCRAGAGWPSYSSSYALPDDSGSESGPEDEGEYSSEEESRAAFLAAAARGAVLFRRSPAAPADTGGCAGAGFGAAAGTVLLFASVAPPAAAVPARAKNARSELCLPAIADKGWRK
jgi:hypothetical protein